MSADRQAIWRRIRTESPDHAAFAVAFKALDGRLVQHINADGEILVDSVTAQNTDRALEINQRRASLNLSVVYRDGKLAGIPTQ